MQSSRVCAICGGSFASTDAVVYLRGEDTLMHRSCCHLHPSCRCDESSWRSGAPRPDAAPEEATAA